MYVRAFVCKCFCMYVFLYVCDITCMCGILYEYVFFCMYVSRVCLSPDPHVKELLLANTVRQTLDRAIFLDIHISYM